MAKDKQSNKAPGRWGQIFTLYRETIKVDKLALLLTLLVALVSIGVSLVLALPTFADGNIIGGVVYSVLGLVATILLSLLVMSNRAQKVAYGRIAGQAGAVGAVLTSSIRRGWRTSEMPVAINPRTRDAIYRAVGAAGIVLITEGSRAGTKLILDEELRKLKRVAPSVQVHVFYVTNDASGTPLIKLAREITRLKRNLNRAEVSAVNSRLQALGNFNAPIPKGIDPRKMRATHK
jgi:hypothetical protein